MMMPKKLSLSLFCALGLLFAQESEECIPLGPNGWSIDIGGEYTWMAFTTPPTYSGSTGGVIGKVTYQMPWDFFGQARTAYNAGPLSNTSFHEWYLEFVGGYSLFVYQNWMFTPYVGIGLDFLSNKPSSTLEYQTYYALIGFDTHYASEDWAIGIQFDSFPIFNQYLQVEGLPEAAWTLDSRVGFDARLPIAYRLPLSSYKVIQHIWLELTPYYRWLPIGESNALALPERNLNQWGAFLTFRFFL